MILIRFLWDIVGLGSLYLLLGMFLVRLGLEGYSLRIYIEFGLYSVILLSLLMLFFRLHSMFSRNLNR